jgi:HAD superfamily hydrolase (TIGR01490 family)
MEAAFFDLDKTVIAKASMVAFGGPLRRAGLITRRHMVRALWSGLVFHYLGADEDRMRRYRESALRITRGWDRATIASLVHETLTDVIDPIVYAEALALIEQHRAAGRLVFLVSASPEEIVRPLGEYLGIDRTIASRASLDEHGRYTGEVDFYAYGPHKAEAIREVSTELGIDLSASFAYSDSITDLPLLQEVGHPFVVNPDRDLARVARQENWPVLQFRHGVPLRERVALPPPGPLAVGAAIAGGVTAGALIGWWILARHPSSGASRLRRPAAS